MVNNGCNDCNRQKERKPTDKLQISLLRASLERNSHTLCFQWNSWNLLSVFERFVHIWSVLTELPKIFLIFKLWGKSLVPLDDYSYFSAFPSEWRLLKHLYVTPTRVFSFFVGIMSQKQCRKDHMNVSHYFWEKQVA